MKKMNTKDVAITRWTVFPIIAKIRSQQRRERYEKELKELFQTTEQGVWNGRSDIRRMKDGV